MQHAIRPLKAGVLSPIFSPSLGGAYSRQILSRRVSQFHDDGRNRLSAFWAPTGGITHGSDTQEDAHSMLIRGGFIRQAHSGLFQFLPLGLRIQEKIERLLDKHMTKIGASKISLSTLSSEDLWEKSGRLKSGGKELFRLEDRKSAKYLLSPTHEEEITSLVGSIIKSYKQLPLRLYQITRKYRDEFRPRQGLLRAREFLMKDLYTFDSSKQSALQTYETVRKAYAAFFDEFKIPYLTAEASSGNIGGDLNHEYHLPSVNGEDTIISCTSCTYVANEELAGAGQPRVRVTSPGISASVKEKSLCNDEKPLDSVSKVSLDWEGKYSVWRGISENRRMLYEAIFPNQVEVRDGSGLSLRSTEINRHALKKYADDIDLSVEDVTDAWTSMQANEKILRASSFRRRSIVHRLYDYRLPQTFIENYEAKTQVSLRGPQLNSSRHDREYPPVDLIKPHDGDNCSKCDTGTLKVESAIELGHTFHLGTRYSDPLRATFFPHHSSQPDTGITASVVQPSQRSQNAISKSPSTSLLQMGCHGIGVSRMIAAIAESLRDSKGLNWPRVMAPFEVIIVPTTPGLDADATAIYDLLVEQKNDEYGNPRIDAILDDRNKVFGWKLADADLIGYPIIVVLGRDWPTERACEVQCRRLNEWREIVPERKLREVVHDLLGKL